MAATGTKTLLLVDDNPADLTLYSRVLGEAGYRIITSLGGTNSLGMHHNEKPSLILLDYMLNSNVSALSLAKILREIFPNALIMVFSVFKKLPLEMRGVADGLLTKGEPDRLVEEVRNLLDQRSKGTAASTAN